MVLLRGCYHQILGPRRHLPKLANGRCRHPDVWVRLDPHLSWQVTKSDVEAGNAFGLVAHHGPSVSLTCTTRAASSLLIAAVINTTHRKRPKAFRNIRALINRCPTDEPLHDCA